MIKIGKIFLDPCKVIKGTSKILDHIGTQENQEKEEEEEEAQELDRQLEMEFKIFMEMMKAMLENLL